MRGEFNGLQRKILDENPYALYVHCYAHRLQLVVVSVASSCSSIHDFFEYISLIVTTTSASCKRMDALREAQHNDILTQLASGEISKGMGLHQQSSLARAGDTRWGSHYTSLIRLDQMWASVLNVLSTVDEVGRLPSQAAGLIEKMESFKFAFILKLMLKLFGITNELSKMLQRKDLNIVLAMELVDDVKARLATLRENGWDDLFVNVQKFCIAKGIPMPNMDAEIPVRGRSRLEGRFVTNLHHYRAEIFYVAIDKICVEMDHRFSEG
ncbi:zinc finger MYM-type protein 1-like, partial [Trifolium pratense]